MSEEDPRGLLMKFRDGPMAGHGNIPSLDGGQAMLVSSDVWSWPLPERLGVLVHLEQTDNVAMWDADGDGDGLPDVIWRSPNAVVYVKLSESQMPRGASHVVRGAEYGIESVKDL